ncbi:TPA: hypothetical protein LVL98_003007 [Klebsiella michiganensis]|nr:hypothetical protein [Klebsiella michiganensis]
MTTDITELAQREKFEAWAEEVGALPWGILKKHRNQDGSYPGPHYTYMWKAWQAASVELVEALEKSQQRNSELESRTVNIKFVPIQVEQLGNVSDGKKHPYMFGAGYNSAVIHCESVIQQELDAKGIKWEAE